MYMQKLEVDELKRFITITILDLRQYIDDCFDTVDRKFDHINRRFDEVNQKIDDGFAGVGEAIEQINNLADARESALNRRFLKLKNQVLDS